jgi:hypothetical protein
MRVSIDYGQGSQGIFGNKPRFDVRVSTQFTAEEAAAIKQVGLTDLIVLQWERRGESFNCTAGQLVKGGTTCTFDGFIDARNFTEEVKRQLSTLKGVINEAVAVSAGHSESFEL